MKPPYEIVETKMAHLRELVPNLREGDLAEIAASGQPPRHALFRLWRNSVTSSAALIDGEVAAVWGVTSSYMSPEGEAWLLTGKCIERLPLAFFKEIRYVVQDMLKLWPALTSAVAVDYERAVRFMRLVGFDIGEPFEVGPNKVKFYRMRMERHGL